jgi:hypothetical protein
MSTLAKARRLFFSKSAEMARKGCALSEFEIKRILQLLSSTEMTPLEIALRMGCSPSAVRGVNSKHQIRHYNGKRNWEKAAV